MDYSRRSFITTVLRVGVSVFELKEADYPLRQLNAILNRVKYTQIPDLFLGKLELRLSCVLWSDGPDPLPWVEATNRSESFD